MFKKADVLSSVRFNFVLRDRIVVIKMPAFDMAKLMLNRLLLQFVRQAAVYIYVKVTVFINSRNTTYARRQGNRTDKNIFHIFISSLTLQ